MQFPVLAQLAESVETLGIGVFGIGLREHECPERLPEIFAEFGRDGVGACVGELFEGLEGLYTMLAGVD